MTNKLGTCDRKQYEHSGPHTKIGDIGQSMPPFPCVNWRPKGPGWAEPYGGNPLPSMEMEETADPESVDVAPQDDQRLVHASGAPMRAKKTDLDRLRESNNKAESQLAAQDWQMRRIRPEMNQLLHEPANWTITNGEYALYFSSADLEKLAKGYLQIVPLSALSAQEAARELLEAVDTYGKAGGFVKKFEMWSTVRAAADKLRAAMILERCPWLAAAIERAAQTLPASQDGVASANGWVSVQERLPEAGETVLVWLLFGKADVDSIGDSPAGGETWNEWNNKVTHWRELPEPPAEPRAGRDLEGK